MDKTISPRLEWVRVKDALQYIEDKTAWQFERRTFQRWVRLASISINDEAFTIHSMKVGRLWHIERNSLDELIAFLSEQE